MLLKYLFVKWWMQPPFCVAGVHFFKAPAPVQTNSIRAVLYGGIMLHDLRIKYEKVPGNDEIIYQICVLSIICIYSWWVPIHSGNQWCLMSCFSSHPCDFWSPEFHLSTHPTECSHWLWSLVIGPTSSEPIPHDSDFLDRSNGNSDFFQSKKLLGPHHLAIIDHHI